MISQVEYQSLIASLPNTTIVAVSKGRSLSEIRDAIILGFTNFGENRLAELKAKALEYPLVTWHFIGHIQTNKIKEIVKYAAMIQSVDRIEVAQQIDQEARKLNKVMPILIQVNTLKEVSKSGVDIENLASLLKSIEPLQNVHLAGLMVMGPTSQVKEETEKAFAIGHHLFHQYQELYPSMQTLSMGMSADYLLAHNNHSTMVRIGRKIFE